MLDNACINEDADGTCVEELRSKQLSRIETLIGPPGQQPIVGERRVAPQMNSS
jgi:hypothetical protein